MATSGDALARPSIKPNYLSATGDIDIMLAGIRFARRIFAAPALAEHVVHELAPGTKNRTDDELLSFARQNGTTLYHPVGTCKMGTDPMAVVDPRLRLRGLDRLRVIDASVMPAVTTGNTNAPTIMIAEKGAAMILEDAKNA